MGLFERRKKNGDYFVDIIRSVTKTETNTDNLVKNFDEHVKGDYERRKIDRDWQKGIDTILQKAIECPKAEQIEGIQDDVDVLKSDKKGIKMIYKFILGGLGVIAITLGILWRLGLL